MHELELFLKRYFGAVVFQATGLTEKTLSWSFRRQSDWNDSESFRAMPSLSGLGLDDLGKETPTSQLGVLD